MYNVKAWLNNPNRSYVDGLTIYELYKPSKKYDAFFGVSSPGIAQVNMLFSKITRIHSKLLAQPSLIVIEKDEPIKIKKVLAKKAMKLNPNPVNRNTDAIGLRSNKKYVNKLLALDYSELSFNDKLIFNNDEAHFLEKKAVFINISDSMRDIRGLHAKIKVIDPHSKFDGERKKIIQDIAYLDNNVKDAWNFIDTWTDNVQIPTVSVSDTAVAKAMANLKKIKANNIFIKRALISIPLMPNKSLKQKDKKVAKQIRLDKRIAELITLGAPYKA